jgi:arsenite methyltransferase
VSSPHSTTSETPLPEWLAEIADAATRAEGATASVGGRDYVVRAGIPRSTRLVSAAQGQTADAFGFKWQRRDSFEGEAMLRPFREWIERRYGPVEPDGWFAEHGSAPLVLDAGCGAAMGAAALLHRVLPGCRYLGVDVSDAVEVAAQRFAENGWTGAFLQEDLMALPLPSSSVDVIFSEGVLHHTDSTEAALAATARLLKPGGRFLFYVYRRKGPIREFTDDLVRDRLQEMAPEQAWRALEPLTKLGIALGELQVEIEVPESIDLLGIPAGRIDLQRLFYWHVAKAFYRPDMTLDEMNHINFDWYAPRNAHRQTPEEVRTWCSAAGLTIEREVVEEAGITVVARREG